MKINYEKIVTRILNYIYWDRPYRNEEEKQALIKIIKQEIEKENK